MPLLLELGELFLKREMYDEARTHLEKAHQLDPEDPWPVNSLGVACSRVEDYHWAVEYYEKALKLGLGDFTIWSNLAETYLKLNKTDRAEKEYRKILLIAANHIDSQLGLGEVYSAMADCGETDLYEVALKHYGRAIQLAQSGGGSKRVKPRELAGMFYARGYARVKAYEAMAPLREEALLRAALHDFAMCFKYDPEHYKGERAKQKITKLRRAFIADWFTRKLAQWLILVPSAFILVQAQFGFYQFGFYRPRHIDVPEYIALTFGALVFLVVGLFLPQITKLKGPGIELEKSQINQIATSGGLGITK